MAQPVPGPITEFLVDLSLRCIPCYSPPPYLSIYVQLVIHRKPTLKYSGIFLAAKETHYEPRLDQPCFLLYFYSIFFFLLSPRYHRFDYLVFSLFSLSVFPKTVFFLPN